MHLPNFIIHYLGILNEQFFDLIDQHLRIGPSLDFYTMNL